MNFAVIANNDMKMPVLILTGDKIIESPVHTHYYNITSYSKVKYILLGDIIYIKWSILRGSGWYSLGDLFIFIGVSALNSILIGNYIYKILNYRRRLKTKIHARMSK
jgi:hypothetical protein